MSLENEILSRIDASQLAAQLDTDTETAQHAAADAVRVLLGGMNENVQSPEGERALAGALQSHAKQSNLFGSSLDDTLDLGQVDTGDGEAIVRHVLGADQFGGLQAAQTAGVDQAMLNKVLKLLAPIVMAYIAKRITEGQGQVLDQAKNEPAGGGGILGQILGKVLGGGAATPAPAPQAPQQAPTPQAPAQSSQPQIQTPASTHQTSGGDLRIDLPEEDAPSAPTQQQSNHQQGGGSILGQILGQVLGGR